MKQISVEDQRSVPAYLDHISLLDLRHNEYLYVMEIHSNCSIFIH
jgi:hypothetical protein